MWENGGVVASGYRVSRKSRTKSDRVRNNPLSALIPVNSTELNRFEKLKNNLIGLNLLMVFRWINVSYRGIVNRIKSNIMCLWVQ